MNITELTCRVCLQEQEVLINVYDELEDLNTNLSNLLETCADFQIREDDYFPKYLCEDCTRELLITSQFRQKCDKAKLLLSEMLANAGVIGFQDLSNSSDIIEYCSEDLDDVDINDLVVKEPANHDESVIAETITPTDQICQLSLLKQPAPLEPMQYNELENQLPFETVTEEAVLTDNTCHQGLSETPDTIISVPWSGTCAVLEDDSLNSLLTKTASERTKLTNIFKCDVCGALFKQAMNLQKHLQKSHATEHCFICDKCSHCFSLESEFSKHVENCTNTKTIVEKNVDKVPNVDAQLNADIEEESSRKCIYCERTFSTPFSLRMHLRTHTGERPFQCKYCIKSFKTRSQLNVHHKRHTGQADFICTICNKSFYEQSNLSVHMRSHTGERPHVCSVCNKTFARVFLLQFHMRTHTGEKPFKCNFCDKYFRQHTDLRNHLTIHTGKKQHACLLCGKSYIKRSHLMQHMKRHHQVQGNIANTTAEAATVQQDENCKTFYNFSDVIESQNIVHSDNFE